MVVNKTNAKTTSQLLSHPKLWLTVGSDPANYILTERGKVLVKSTSVRWCALLLIAGWLWGCAASGDGHRSLQRMIARGQYEQAEQVLLLQTVQRPDDAATHRLLGIAQYHLENYGSAEGSLARALELAPRDAVARFYAGMLAERTDKIDAAIYQYESFLSLKKTGDLAQRTRRRLVELKLQSARQFSQTVVADEKDISPGTLPDSTIGVVYFNGRFLSEALRPLTTGLAELLTVDLAKVGALRVVERIRLNQILAELQLAQSAAFDTSTAPRLGKLLGAAHVLGGAIAELPSEKLRIDPSLVNTKSGEVSLPEEAVGNLDEIIQMEKRVALAIIDKLGIKLTRAERDSIVAVPTESFLAFLMFSRGLEWFDKAEYRKAAREFNRAVEADPEFKEAEEMGRLAEALLNTPSYGRIGDFERYAIADPFVRGRSGEVEQALAGGSDRLHFMPGTGRGYDEPYVGPYGRRPITATIIIQGQFADEP